MSAKALPGVKANALKFVPGSGFSSSFFCLFVVCLFFLLRLTLLLFGKILKTFKNKKNQILSTGSSYSIMRKGSGIEKSDTERQVEE